MNSNATIPTITTDGVGNSYVYIGWTMGNGHTRQVGIPVSGDGKEDAAESLIDMVQHVYLMGVESGEGIITGIEVDRLDDGMQRTIAQLRQQLSEADTRYASLAEQGRILLESRAEQIRELTEQRDALADSLHQAQSGILGDEGMKDQARREVVQAYQDGYANAEDEDAVNPFVMDGDPRRDHWSLGRFNRRQFNDNGQRIEALMGQVRTTREEWQGRWNRMLEEVGRLGDLMLAEADRRNWCAEYEGFARSVNDVNTVVTLPMRTKTYTVTFTVEAEPSDTEYALNRMSHVYNVECDQNTTYTVSATIECNQDDIETEVEELRRTLSDVTNVVDVTHEGTDEDS